ncbi:DUF2254 family protein [Streptomyces candidus]|uniref:DUF2254 family protein n=1 Tax=Streptomyces candidus TaxID=67283 RepID=UPI0016160D10|nr:DUF2254 family protein [Streptomyces candidus]
MRDALRAQLWPLPTLGVALAVGAGVGLPRLDQRLRHHMPSWLREYLFGGNADAVRSVLEAIAGSLVTAEGETFGHVCPVDERPAGHDHRCPSQDHRDHGYRPDDSGETRPADAPGQAPQPLQHQRAQTAASAGMPQRVKHVAQRHQDKNDPHHGGEPVHVGTSVRPAAVATSALAVWTTGVVGTCGLVHRGVGPLSRDAGWKRRCPRGSGGQ